MKKSIAIVCIVLATWIKITAQTYSTFPNTGTYFDKYFVETRDTVSSHFGVHIIVRNMVQDKNDIIWLASWKGIVSYDGKVFTNHTLKENLVHAHVVSVFMDNSGNIWFGTTNAGVYRYDGKSFKLFTSRDGLINNSVACMAQDKAGNIWFGTVSGASRYDGVTFTSFAEKDGLRDKYINTIITDQKGNVWFGASNGVSLYNGKIFTDFKDNKNEDFKRVANLFEDKSGLVWIGSEKGLCSFDGKVLKDVPETNLVMYMCQDRDDNLWFAYNTYPANKNFVLYRYNQTGLTKMKEMNEPENGWQIFGIIEDSKNNIWFGTMNGPCCYDGKSFRYFAQ